MLTKILQSIGDFYNYILIYLFYIYFHCRTRQLVSFVTVIPEADELIQAIYIDHPLVRYHTGLAVAENITNVTQTWISKDQYQSGSYDGQYHNLGVTEVLNKHFDVSREDVQSDWDPLHKCGISDKRMRKKKNSKWVGDMTSHISESFKDHNYGKGYEELIEACESLEIDLKDPKFHSDTRFANSCHSVYKSFYNDLPAIILNYEKVITEHEEALDNKLGDKAQKASRMLKKLRNKHFILSLAGLVDIYSTFSAIVCYVQKVNILPFQRYDVFQDYLKHFQTMLDQIGDHSLCKHNNKEKCSWPNFHKDEKNILAGKFHGNLNITSEQAENTRITRYFAKKQGDAEKVEVAVQKQLKRMLEDLLVELKEVFDAEDIKWIEACRKVTDVSSFPH